MDPLSSLALGSATAVLLWLVLAQIAGAAAGVLVKLLAPLPGALRAPWLLLLAFYPLLLAPVLASALFLAPLSALVVGAHCHTATGCAPHAPVVAVTDGAVSWLGTVAGAVVLLLLCAALLGLRRRAALDATLAMLARPGTTTDWRVLDSAQPALRCVGLWRPTVVVSTALLEQSTQAELERRLLDARARCLRRDDLWAVLARLATAAWPASGRHRLLAALDAAAAASRRALVMQVLGRPASLRSAREARMPAAGDVAPAQPGPPCRHHYLRLRLRLRLVLVVALGVLPLGLLPELLHRLAEHILPLA